MKAKNQPLITFSVEEYILYILFAVFINCIITLFVTVLIQKADYLKVS